MEFSRALLLPISSGVFYVCYPFSTGTYELTKDELVLKQTIIDMYEEKKATFDYTEKLRRKK